MQEPSDEVDGYKSANLFIKKENFKRWLELFYDISGFVYHKIEIPPLLMQEFFTYLHLNFEINIRAELKKSEAITKKATAFFLTKKDYQFESLTASSIEMVILYCTQHYFARKKTDKSLEDKNNTIRFFYLILSIALTENRKEFTKYKRAALSAYLTRQVGFKVATKPPSTPHDYFKASDYALKKMSFIVKNYLSFD